MWKKLAYGFVAVLLIAILILAKLTTGYPAALKPPSDRPTAIVIQNVTVISMVEGETLLQPDLDVRIEGEAITGIGSHGTVVIPDGAMQIDAAGQYLMPGLIDAHVHLWDEAEMAGYLRHGVTTIRNMSGMPFHLDLQKRLASGKIIGPHLLTTGPILNSPGPNAQDNHVMVSTEEEAREAVRKQYRQGYRHLKIYSNLTREAYAGILDEAAELGMTVSGHTPEGLREAGVPEQKPFDIPFTDILDDDLLTIEHAESIFWHGLRDDLETADLSALIDQIAMARVTVTPTLIAHDNLVRVARSKGAYLEREGVDTINPALLELDAGTRAYWSHQDPDVREAPRAEYYREMTAAMEAAGVRLITGTDAGIFTNIPGSSMTRELELLVLAGLSPEAALASATRNGADALLLARRGRIQEGAIADIVLLDQNPLEDVGAVEFPAAVVVNGLFLDSAALERLSEGASQTNALRSYRRLGVMLLNQ